MKEQISDTTDKIKETGEMRQEDMQHMIISTLMRFFNVDSVAELKSIMKSGSREGNILKTAIQTDRNIDSVDIIVEDKNVVVDEDNKKKKNVVIPKGTLKIVYSRSSNDVADLIVYVWRNEDGEVRREIVAQNIDSEKAMGEAMKNIKYSPTEGERNPYGDIPEIDGTGKHIRSKQMSDGDHPNK